MPSTGQGASLRGHTIGFIGLGLMGQPMSRNLLNAGARLLVWNRSPGPVEDLKAAGAVPMPSPAALAREAQTVIVMVADAPAVEAVVLGKDGIVATLRPEGLVIDMGTTAVGATRRFAKAVAEAGGDYVDAPVSGGTIGAEAGTLTIMAGGSVAGIERARAVFDVLGSRLTHVGPTGAGQIAKAANQMIVGLSIGAVAEALTLAKRAGADPAKVRDALKGGFADSRILEIHGQRMISGDFRPGSKSTTQRKDMAQALALAADVGVTLPATRLNLELYEKLIGLGFGDLDHAALIKAIDVAPAEPK